MNFLSSNYRRNTELTGDNCIYSQIFMLDLYGWGTKKQKVCRLGFCGKMVNITGKTEIKCMRPMENGENANVFAVYNYSLQQGVPQQFSVGFQISG